MSPPRDFAALIAEKDALILAQAETIAPLMKRIAELEARLGLPPKTPNNSGTPPSKCRKASGGLSSESGPKAKGKPHRGAHRSLHPDPTARRDILAAGCASPLWGLSLLGAAKRGFSFSLPAYSGMATCHSEYGSPNGEIDQLGSTVAAQKSGPDYQDKLF